MATTGEIKRIVRFYLDKIGLSHAADSEVSKMLAPEHVSYLYDMVTVCSGENISEIRQVLYYIYGICPVTGYDRSTKNFTDVVRLSIAGERAVDIASELHLAVPTVLKFRRMMELQKTKKLDKCLTL